MEVTIDRLFFFFQAEDGIRDIGVTGVQTCALPICLRAAFDGAVSLGRVQTPTLALVARREEEIRAFKPEPYWLVEAAFLADPDRAYRGRYLGGKRIDEQLAAQIGRASCRERV